MNKEDMSWALVWYHEMENVCAFDLSTLDCIIGQVKVGNWWGVIDQSFRSEHAVMHSMWEPEYESEDKND